MELWEAIRERRSFRFFKPGTIPKDRIEKVLRAGLEAPSSANMQPWEFVVVCGIEKDKLSKILLRSFAEKGKDYDFKGKESRFPAKLLNRREKLFRELFRKLEQDGLDPKKFLQEGTLRFYGAPVIILVFMDNRIEKRFFFDIGTCVQNILLAAQAEGLGSHLIGLVLKFQDTIKEVLGISSAKRLVVGICLGYPDLENPINRFKPERERLDQMVEWIGF